MVQVLRHRDQMILNIGQIKPDVGLGGHAPVFVATFCQTFDDIGLVAHESKKTHNLFTTRSDPAKCDIRVVYDELTAERRSTKNRSSPSQHVALLCFLQNQHQLIDPVYLVLDALD